MKIRSVAFTLHVLKVQERLVLTHLGPQFSSFLDPLQFAYEQQFGVDHLMWAAPTTDMIPFSVIQLLLLREKMSRMQVSNLHELLIHRQFLRQN
ncbi:uncharacterized protein LOC119780138 [Tachysurus ichikawai]